MVHDTPEVQRLIHEYDVKLNDANMKLLAAEKTIKEALLIVKDQIEYDGRDDHLKPKELMSFYLYQSRFLMKVLDEYVNPDNYK